jgi:hypothetical protein
MKTKSLNYCLTNNFDDFMSYLTFVHDTLGEFCGDCEHLNSDDECLKNHRPNRYLLEMGPFEDVYICKNCKDFELYKGQVAEMKTNVMNQGWGGINV